MYHRLVRLIVALSLGVFVLPLVEGAVVEPVSAQQYRYPRSGDSGPEIVRMQQALIARGASIAGGVSGSFDASTTDALRRLQRAAGLPVSGSLDSRTAKLLGLGRTIVVAPAVSPVVVKTATVTKPSAPRPTRAVVAVGSRGEEVRGVQRALLANGITILGGVDGIYGRGTQAAVAEFQRRNGLRVTGNVDAGTQAALGAAITPVTQTPVNNPVVSTPVAGRLPQRGDRGEGVRALQSSLVSNGITLAGGVDGVFGAATAAAISAFQQARGLNASGVLDIDTAAALGLSPSLEELGLPRLAVFPMQGRCSFIDDWGAPRSGGRTHEGTDIIGARGLAIYAVTDGVITRMHTGLALGGNAIRLTMADGTYFFYAHLDSFAPGITPGTAVRAGQIIGYNGSTGNAGGPHLHFEVHPRGGAAVNPFPLLKAIDACGRTELLPQG